MGSWGCNPTYRGFLPPFITFLWAHLVELMTKQFGKQGRSGWGLTSSNILMGKTYISYGILKGVCPRRGFLQFPMIS